MRWCPVRACGALEVVIQGSEFLLYCIQVIALSLYRPIVGQKHKKIATFLQGKKVGFSTVRWGPVAPLGLELGSAQPLLWFYPDPMGDP